jgi:hypothetical protein
VFWPSHRFQDGEALATNAALADVEDLVAQFLFTFFKLRDLSPDAKFIDPRFIVC